MLVGGPGSAGVSYVGSIDMLLMLLRSADTFTSLSTAAGWIGDSTSIKMFDSSVFGGTGGGSSPAASRSGVGWLPAVRRWAKQSKAVPYTQRHDYSTEVKREHKLTITEAADKQEHELLDGSLTSLYTDGLHCHGIWWQHTVYTTTISWYRYIWWPIEYKNIHLHVSNMYLAFLQLHFPPPNNDNDE